MREDVFVFYAGGVYETYERLPLAELLTLPDGAYLYFRSTNSWKHLARNQLNTIPKDTVPKTLRAWMLLLA